MTHKHVLLCTFLSLLAPTRGFGQTDRVDEFIAAEMRRQNIPGLSLAVLQHGEIIKTKGYGFANRADRIPATPGTVYRIASVSKQFIAAGVMCLVQEGRISLNDPIEAYLDDAPVTWNRITIRHLLTHTSGLAREAPGFDPHKVQTDAELIRTAYGLPLRFTPGAKWEYSNLGYFALAEIIHEVSGRPWTQYLADRVFTPLGMSSTLPTNTRDSIHNRATGYVDNNELRVAPEWSALRPSGAFLSTVLDLAKWDAALYTGDILTDSTRQQMWTPVTLNDGSTAPYGYGWMFTTFKGHKLVHHPGGMPGTRADVARFVDDGLTIIVLMNLDDVDIGSIVLGIANLYLSTSPAPPNFNVSPDSRSILAGVTSSSVLPGSVQLHD